MEEESTNLTVDRKGRERKPGSLGQGTATSSFHLAPTFLNLTTYFMRICSNSDPSMDEAADKVRALGDLPTLGTLGGHTQM